MKLKVLIAAAAVACGGAAFAQADASRSGDHTARASEMQHQPASPRMREGARKMVDKTRQVTRRATDKVREVARRDRAGDQRQARAERMDRSDRSYRADAQASHRANDTRAMGGAPRGDVQESDASRRARMDAAYAKWQMQQDAPRR